MPNEKQKKINAVELYNIRLTEPRKKLLKLVEQSNLINDKKPLSQLFDDLLRIAISNPAILKQEIITSTEKYAFLNYWEEGFKSMAEAMKELTQEVALVKNEMRTIKDELYKNKNSDNAQSFFKDEKRSEKAKIGKKD